MKTIVEGDLISSKTGSFAPSQPDLIQVVPVRYVKSGEEDKVELTIFLKTSCQQLNISISLEEWDNFIQKLNQEIVKINSCGIVLK